MFIILLATIAGYASASGFPHGQAHGIGHHGGYGHGPVGHAHGAHGAHVHGKYTYHGKYPGKCGADGLYYSDATAFVFCSNGNSYVQPCAPGTRNSGYNRYSYGQHYTYRDFCDVNLVDYGYAARGYGYNRGHNALDYGHGRRDGYGHHESHGFYGGAGHRAGYGVGHHHGVAGYGNKGYGHGTTQGASYGYKVTHHSHGLRH